MDKTEYKKPDIQVQELSIEYNLLNSGNGSGQNLESPVIAGGDYTDYFN